MKSNFLQIRGFKKPNRKMKLIIDNSFSPIELARAKYMKLYEQQIFFKKEKENRKKSPIIYIFEQIKNTL